MFPTFGGIYNIYLIIKKPFVVLEFSFIEFDEGLKLPTTNYQEKC